MARHLRIEFDRALYHVTSGGNAREPIFINIKNRVLFLDKNESALKARTKPNPFGSFFYMCFLTK